MSEVAKHEQWQEWMEEFQEESDRACAVLGPAFLDHHLKMLLGAFFVDAPEVKELFGNFKPLGSFAARIDVAFALGFLAPTERRDLNLIRKIRNDFSHHLHGLDFSTPSIADRCKELSTCRFIEGGAIGVLGPRGKFVGSVVLLANWIAIRRLGIREKRRVVHSEVRDEGANIHKA